jgi:hypothetical protein
MQTRLPQACRWVSIAVHYLPLQRRPISPSLPQSPGKNLPGRIPLHHPMVTTDSGLFLLRLSSHLSFLHFISRPTNCILFSISKNPIPFIDVPGVEKGGCVLVILDRTWSPILPGFGLQRRASHDPPRSFDQSPRDL